ncbi:hypothetical protein C8R42DRAFT_684404 [Lentinula raphanica]|nr:hypothetical protein C8R42DRAFT_684404 [Lentinula raphanica]
MTQSQLAGFLSHTLLLSQVLLLRDNLPCSVRGFNSVNEQFHFTHPSFLNTGLEFVSVNSQTIFRLNEAGMDRRMRLHRLWATVLILDPRNQDGVVGDNEFLLFCMSQLSTPQLNRMSVSHLLNPLSPQSAPSRVSVLALMNPAPRRPPVVEDELNHKIIHRDFDLTNRTVLKVVYEHGESDIVEYPISGGRSEEVVGHLFRRDTNSWTNPANDFAYSRGPPRGYSTGVKVSLMVDAESGNMVPCTVRHSTCQGVKVCPFYDYNVDDVVHSSASREQLQSRLKHDRELRAMFRSPAADVFERTSAFIAALRRTGCPGTSLVEDNDSSEDEDFMHLRRGYPLKRDRCTGQLVFGYQFNGDAFIKCEHYSTQARDHFFDCTIGNGSYHLDYLEAIFTEDDDEVERIEEELELIGYGPRSSCHTVMNVSSQRPVCPFNHRDASGILKQPKVERIGCSCVFREYEPVLEFRDSCPYILVTSKGPHSHPIPLPEKTPYAIKNDVYQLVHRLDVDMADITPRQFLRHPIVKTYLASRFPLLRNPMLSDLHVSLSNRSHLRVYIETVKKDCFPYGTSWKGLEYLKQQQDSLLPINERYIRQMIELPASHLENDVDDASADDPMDDTFRFVICMTPEASSRLAVAQHLQSDIAFKRIVGFYEFELASKDPDSNTSMTYCRVFLTRQTADAHRRILVEINKLVHLDTGRSLRWRHIHGESLDDHSDGLILNWVVDQHGGQAKGIGMFLEEISRSLPLKADFHQPLRSIQSLGPYDHLQRFLTLCTTHFARNIRQCQVPESVRNLMRSLVSVQHNEWEETVQAIQEHGGIAGQNWVADKIRAKFVFPGICWEKSFIPLDIWNARERDSNVSEILHADVNREGVHCSLVGGIKKSMHYDHLKLISLKNLESMGIRESYKSKSSTERATRNLKRRSHNRNKRYHLADEKIALHNKKIEILWNKLQSATNKTRAKFELMQQDSTSEQAAHRAWKKAKEQETRARVAFDKQVVIGRSLVNTGSGKINVVISV